jgi:DNA-binding LacI/PurR family transcriptional regulator
MKRATPTQQQVYLIAGTAAVSEPTVRRFFRGTEQMRPAMMERIVGALSKLNLMDLYPQGKK